LISNALLSQILKRINPHAETSVCAVLIPIRKTRDSFH